MYFSIALILWLELVFLYMRAKCNETYLESCIWEDAVSTPQT